MFHPQGERQRRLEAKAKRKEARERELEQIDLEEARLVGHDIH